LIKDKKMRKVLCTGHVRMVSIPFHLHHPSSASLSSVP
jgi:hypothetical protein